VSADEQRELVRNAGKRTPAWRSIKSWRCCGARGRMRT